MHSVSTEMANGFFSGVQAAEAFPGWRNQLARNSCFAHSWAGIFRVVKLPWVL